MSLAYRSKWYPFRSFFSCAAFGGGVRRRAGTLYCIPKRINLSHDEPGLGDELRDRRLVLSGVDGTARRHRARPFAALRVTTQGMPSPCQCAAVRDSPVMLSAAKHLAAHRARPFAALRVTSSLFADWTGVLEEVLSMLISKCLIRDYDP